MICNKVINQRTGRENRFEPVQIDQSLLFKDPQVYMIITQLCARLCNFIFLFLVAMGRIGGQL